jgi:hypothetical protein
MRASPGHNTKSGSIPGVAGVTSDASLLSSLVVAAQTAYRECGWGSLSAAGVTASIVDLKILRGVVDACDAALRTRAAELQPPPPPPPPGPTPPPPPPPPPPESGQSGAGAASDQPDVSQSSLDEKSGVGAASGRRRARHAKVLGHFPSFAAALVAGEITESHVAVLSEVLFSATDEVWEALRAEEDALLIAASRLGPVSYRKFVTQTTIRVAASLGTPVDRDLTGEIFANLWIDKDSGLGRLFASFDPSSFAAISAILGKAAAKLQFSDRSLTEKQALGRALTEMLTQRPGRPSATGGPAVGSSVVPGVKPMVSILIDHKTLLGGAHADTICEYDNGSRLSVEVAREIACTASLTPILRDKWGVVLDLGREFRYATSSQRRAMEAMYATCFHEACDTPITQCHEHHMIYWEHGGRTDMANLLPVCQTHHRWIHANDPHISMDEHRTVTVTMPNGTQSVHRPNRQPYRKTSDEAEPPDMGSSTDLTTSSTISSGFDTGFDTGLDPGFDPGFRCQSSARTEVA